MAREPEHSDQSDILPSPELNPLLNPLLGQHMGRWAEVYFTSPPEKRDEAVQELLRELEAADPSAEASPKLMACPSCGHENPVQHNFCGTCGAPLRGESRVAAAPTQDSFDSEVPQSTLRHEPQPLRHEPRRQEPAISSIEYGEPLPAPRSFYPVLDDPEPRTSLGSGSYRFYVAGAVALVVIVLTYMVWRSTQAISVISRPAPAPAAQQTSQQQTSQQTSPPASNSATSGTETPAPAVVSPPANPAPTPTPSRKAAEPVSYAATPHAANTTTSATSAPTPQETQNSLSGGSDELAVAQGLLGGTDGRQRNSAEAAGWLWKAVSKQNANATLLLSDLYLKGDGVPKNCEQARLLLDAAARKGIKDAAERLRHLPAFGCE